VGHGVTARRPLLAGVLAAIVLGSVAMPVHADTTFTPSGAVKFKVDDVKKTITVTVKLAFYNRSCTGASSCEVGGAEVARIVDAIQRMWNTGLKVKCYTFFVNVDARSVGSQSEAGGSEIDIGLDYGPIPIAGPVAFVRGESNTSDPLVNTPNDRVDAVHDPSRPTTWPASTYDQVYGHEFGHILGLDDNYDKTNPRVPAKGASEDLMFRKQGYVTEEMVKRVVERSGQVNLKDLKCGWKIASTSPDGYHLTGVKCDELDGEWTIQGVLDSGGVHSETVYTVTIAAGTLVGTFQSNAITTTSGIGATSKAHGRASAAAQPDGSVKLSLDATTAVVGAGGESLTLPVPAQQFTWLPVTGTECSAPPP
jgi:hypothetical protein